MLLSKEEYITKLAIIWGADPNTIDIVKALHNDKFEKMYHEYLKSNGETKRITGCVDLDKLKYIELNQKFDSKDASFANGWLVLPDFQKLLLKNVLTDKYSNKSRFYCLCNHLVIPKICSKLGLESANYFLAQKGDKKGIYIITPDFLEKDEELKTGQDISKEMFILGLSNTTEDNIEISERFMNLNSGREEEREDIKQALIKQTVLWYIIKNLDQSKRNWAIRKGNKGIRLAPNYDYDFCLDAVEDGAEYTRVNDENIEEIVNKYRKLQWFRKWLEESVFKLHIQACFLDGKRLLPGKYESIYDEYTQNSTNVIRNRINRIQEICMNVPIEPDIC